MEKHPFKEKKLSTEAINDDDISLIYFHLFHIEKHIIHLFTVMNLKHYQMIRITNKYFSYSIQASIRIS